MQTIKLLSILVFNISYLWADTLLFIHGGPGLNSKPEELILKNYIESKQHTMHFWNEPSKLRDTHKQYSIYQNLQTDIVTYQNSLNSLYKSFHNLCLSEEKISGNCNITVVAHSFGTILAKELIAAFPKNIKKLILVAPVFNLNTADKRLLQVAASGLIKESKHEYGKKILALVPSLKTSFDSNKIEAFKLALNYTSLFTHYFYSSEQMIRYFSHLTNNYQFDLENFFNIRITMPKKSIEDLNVSLHIKIPVYVYFGESDPISTPGDQTKLLKKLFKNVQIFKIPHSSHFVHLEDMDSIRW